MTPLIETLSFKTPTPSGSVNGHVQESVREQFTQDRIAAANAALAGQSPQAILRWAVATYHPRLTMATAFGAEGCCLIHMLAEIEPKVRLFNLETGYQFQETLD